MPGLPLPTWAPGWTPGAQLSRSGLFHAAEIHFCLPWTSLRLLRANLIHILQTKILPKYSHALVASISAKQSSLPSISHPPSATTILLCFPLIASQKIVLTLTVFYFLLSPLPARTAVWLPLRWTVARTTHALLSWSHFTSWQPQPRWRDSPCQHVSLPWGSEHTTPSCFSPIFQATPSYSLLQSTSYPTSTCGNLLEIAVQALSSSHWHFLPLNAMLSQGFKHFPEANCL